jgi:hypothetical protein
MKEGYIIYHHDVAVEMSNRITKHSKNPLLVEFAYEIIKNQRYEIWLMKNYLTRSQQQCSEVFRLKGDIGIEGSYNRISYIVLIIILLLLIRIFIT